MRYTLLIAMCALWLQTAHGQSTIAYFRGPVSPFPEFPVFGDTALNMDGEQDMRFSFGGTICTADDRALKNTCFLDPVGGSVSFYDTHVRLEKE